MIIIVGNGPDKAVYILLHPNALGKVMSLSLLLLAMYKQGIQD